MLHNPYKIVKMFEEEIAHYTGAPYAVSVNSCTNALFLAYKKKRLLFLKELICLLLSQYFKQAENLFLMIENGRVSIN